MLHNGWYTTAKDNISKNLPVEELARVAGLQRHWPTTQRWPKSEREIAAFNFVFVWLHTSAVRREYVYNDFRIQDFRREYRRACRG